MPKEGIIKLSVLERIVLSQLLPKEGTFANLKLLRVVKESLSFTEEENKKLNFRIEGEQTRWDDNVGEKEILVGDTVVQLIRDELTELDKNEKLDESQFSLYEKFMVK